jgi:hypothetical protein
MLRDPAADPRSRPLGPAPDEVEAWARREHQRREAWLAGPSEDEQRDWARRYRRRARLGLEESRLGPSREEVAQWAERERARRQAWAEGPSEYEKQEWALRARRAASPTAPMAVPTAEEVAAWAERETLRRRDWLAGPSDEEKEQWARHQGGGAWTGWLGSEGMAPELSELANRVLREAELAGKGSLYALSHAPAAIWSYFVRAGRSFERDVYQAPCRGRVPF